MIAPPTLQWTYDISAKMVPQKGHVYNKVNNRFKELSKDDEPINIIDDKGTYSIPKVDRMFNTSKESSLVGIKKMSKARVKFKPIKKRS